MGLPKFFEVDFNREGLKDLMDIIESKFDEPTKKAIAGALDKFIVFKGVAGTAVEMIDGSLFSYAVDNGLDALFGLLDQAEKE